MDKLIIEIIIIFIVALVIGIKLGIELTYWRIGILTKVFRSAEEMEVLNYILDKLEEHVTWCSVND